MEEDNFLVDKSAERAIFVYTMSLILNEPIAYNKSFSLLMEGFYNNCYIRYPDLFDECWGPYNVDKVFGYLNMMNNPMGVKKVYDLVSNEVIDDITELAYCFDDYVNIIYDISYSSKVRC